MDCKHIFEGRADGVHCKLCGLHMTPDEYSTYLRGPEQPPEERKLKTPQSKRGRKKAEA